MKLTIATRLVLTMFTSFFLFCFEAKALSGKFPMDTEFENKIEQIIEPYVSNSWFSGNVLISNKDGIAEVRSFGMSNYVEQRRNSRCTRFNIGSISKDYTAVLVLQMIEEGKLSYETKLSAFDLGLNPDASANISIEHLLTHRAGFRDIFVPEYMEAPLSFDSLEKKVDLLKSEPLLFEPGSDYRYSNYGYILLGVILEKLTGDSFSELLKKRIFVPIDARNSSLVREENHPCQSDPYTYSIDKGLVSSALREVAGPDGGIESTVDDVFKFFDALFFTDKLLKREGKAFKKFFGTRQSHGSYGGGTGVSAAAEVLRDQQVIIVVLANSDELVAERIATRLNSALRREPVSEFRLPSKHFVYGQYQELGVKRFKKEFPELYNLNGYIGFMGRPINEAGLYLARNGNGQEAIKLISVLGHFYPDAPQAYDSLAYVYYLMGDKNAAQLAFKKARGLSKGFISDYHQTNYGLR